MARHENLHSRQAEPEKISRKKIRIDILKINNRVYSLKIAYKIYIKMNTNRLKHEHIWVVDSVIHNLEIS